MAYCYRYKLMNKPAQVLAPTKSWPSVMLQRPCWPCLASTNPLPSPPNLPSSRPAIRRSVQTCTCEVTPSSGCSLCWDYCGIIKFHDGLYFVHFFLSPIPITQKFTFSMNYETWCELIDHRSTKLCLNEPEKKLTIQENWLTWFLIIPLYSNFMTYFEYCTIC